RALGDNEVFLLGSDKNRSFDSRYFGPVPTQNVIGRLVPLWTE
ncbi:MAG: S26 family signal peptidase, partial [Mesorhizobium sp.]